MAYTYGSLSYCEPMGTNEWLVIPVILTLDCNISWSCRRGGVVKRGLEDVQSAVKYLCKGSEVPEHV
jgi:hypothetical protein